MVASDRGVKNEDDWVGDSVVGVAMKWWRMTDGMGSGLAGSEWVAMSGGEGGREAGAVMARTASCRVWSPMCTHFSF